MKWAHCDRTQSRELNCKNCSSKCTYYCAVLYQVLNKQVPVPVPVPVVQVPVQVPVPNIQVPVPVQVLCINYRYSVTLELQKVKLVVSFMFKKNEQLA